MQIGGSSLITIFQWLKKGTVGITEQGVTSLTAYLLQLALVRFLTLEQYGLFSIAFSILLFIAAAAGAMTFDPMAIVSARRPKDEVTGYIAEVLKLSLILSVAISVCGLGISLIVAAYQPDISFAILLASTVCPLTAAFWTLRRASYVIGCPEKGLIAALISAATMFALIAIFHHFDLLNSASAFGVHAIVALVAAGVLILSLDVSPRLTVDTPYKKLFVEHWVYGKWMLGMTASFWLINGSLPIFAQAFGGVEGAGAIRALINLITPLVQGTAALTALATPRLARRFYEQGLHDAPRFLLILTFAFISIAAVYCILIWIFQAPLIELLLGDNLLPYVHLLAPILLLGFIQTSIQGIGVILTANGSIKTIFFSHIRATSLTAIGAVICAHYFGLAGLLWTFAVGYIFLGLNLLYALKKVLQERRIEGDGLARGEQTGNL